MTNFLRTIFHGLDVESSIEVCDLKRVDMEAHGPWWG